MLALRPLAEKAVCSIETVWYEKLDIKYKTMRYETMKYMTKYMT